MTSSLPVATQVSGRPKVFVVIVLYKICPEASEAFRTLQVAAQEWKQKGGVCEILLYDNSPESTATGELLESVRYEASPANRGLAQAYNRALELAIKGGCDWLLTLDQDTSLPSNYLAALAAKAEHLSDDQRVGAIVPQIWGGTRRLSPNRFVAGAWPQHYPAGYVGIPEHPTFAFNSGSFLRVSALRAIGGYDPRFWLDYCDAFLFRKLHKAGYRVFVAGDIAIQHEFSMQDFKNRVSVARYANVVRAGSAFWDLEMNFLAGLDHTGRLMFRVLKHLWRRDDAAFLKITLRATRDRLLRSKKARLAEWQEELRAQGHV